MELLQKALLILALLQVTAMSTESKEVVRCLGTANGLSVAADRMVHVQRMSRRYRNCTMVEGNLEISGLDNPNFDVSFLKDIEIVTGYVIISLTVVPHLPLENLKIIRGQNLYGPQNTSLMVFGNSKVNSTLGLRELGFKSLSEIQRGNVRISHNHHLCFADKVNWMDVMNPSERRRNGWNVFIDNNGENRTQCTECDSSCTSGHCWGNGPRKCQTLTSSICHSNCGDARCRGPGPNDCCDRECAGGCTGPTDRDCIVCLHMNNHGACQRSCPTQYVYDPATMRNIPNPEFKYHFSDTCVDKCPDNMLIEENGCVRYCRIGRFVDEKGVCVPCYGDKCAKQCYGVGNPNGPMKEDNTVHSANLHHFRGCHTVQGNVIFQSYSFLGDRHMNILPMTTQQVIEAFSSVKVITGYLKIMSWPSNDFRAFANLTTIVGNTLFRDMIALLMQDSIAGPSHLSQVKSLGFRSLKSIKHGNVYIGYMKNLCYHERVNWTKVIKDPIPHTRFSDGLLFRENGANCDAETCDPACSDDGCWGPGADECLSCAHVSYNGRCESECPKYAEVYQEGSECLPCDEECLGICEGPGPDKCIACQHFRYRGVCLRSCPQKTYPDPAIGLCLPCTGNCAMQPFLDIYARTISGDYSEKERAKAIRLDIPQITST